MIDRNELQHGRDFRVNLDLARFFREMIQRPDHGFNVQLTNPRDAPDRSQLSSTFRTDASRD
jgi:hypothetical protein